MPSFDSLLAESEHLTLLVNQLPQTVIEFSLDGVLRFANKHAFKAFRYDRKEDVIGNMNVFDMIIPQDRRIIIELAKKLFAGEDMAPPECTVLRKDGTTFPVIVYANLILDGDKRPIGIRGIIVDISDKRRVEEAYRALVDHSIQGFLIIQDMRIVFFNQQFLRRSGFTADELLDLSSAEVLQHVHPEDVSSLQQHFRSLMDGEPVSPTLEFRACAKDRRMLWLQAFFTRIDFRGHAAVQVALMDATARKTAENLLKESERRYRDLAELLPHGVFETDTDGRITYANRSAVEMIGATPGDVQKGITVADTVVPADLKRAMRGFRRILAGEKVEMGEYTSLRRDGTTFPSLILANPIIRGHACVGIRGVIVDNTAQRRMMANLEESETRYRTLFDSTGAATMVIEEDMGISLANQEFYRLSGYSPEEPLKWPFLIHPEERERMIDYHIGRRKDPSAAPRNYEFRAIRADGEIRNCFLTVSMIPGTKRSVCSIVDITDLKQVEEELRIKTSSLEDANTALRVLLKNMGEERAGFEKNIMANLKELVFPFIEKLKTKKLSAEQKDLVALIENYLGEVVSPFLRTVSSRFSNLTPREIEIISLIKEGRSTKEISKILNTAQRTIDFHRNNIRKKMGISSKKTNLRTFIMTLQEEDRNEDQEKAI